MSSPGLGLAGPSTAADPQAAYRAQIAVAQAGVKRGAGWFDWIAALSLINSLIALFNGNWHFLLGLGITDLVTYAAQRSGSTQG
jgi:hypothetical protein